MKKNDGMAFAQHSMLCLAALLGRFFSTFYSLLHVALVFTIKKPWRPIPQVYGIIKDLFVFPFTSNRNKLLNYM